MEWIRKLTPMDVVNLQFDPDASGRTLLSLKEKNGQTVSADCASDGTLRFLGILAAMFGPDPATVYFIEELENGIHPTRLGLLVELIESQTKRRGIQVIATSHSPQLLQFLSEESIEHASLVYRLPDHPDARIKRQSLNFQTPAVLSMSNPYRSYTPRVGSRTFSILMRMSGPHPPPGNKGFREPIWYRGPSRERVGDPRGLCQGRACTQAPY